MLYMPVALTTNGKHPTVMSLLTQKSSTMNLEYATWSDTYFSWALGPMGFLFCMLLMMIYIYMNWMVFVGCRWAVSSVMTRQNQIPSMDGQHMISALIPLWDMCNHTNGQVILINKLHEGGEGGGGVTDNYSNLDCWTTHVCRPWIVCMWVSYVYMFVCMYKLYFMMVKPGYKIISPRAIWLVHRKTVYIPTDNN